MNEARIEGRCLWARQSKPLPKGGHVTNFALAVSAGRGSTTVKCVAWSSDVGETEIAKDGFYRVSGRLEEQKAYKEYPAYLALVAESIEEVLHKSTRPKAPPPPPDPPMGDEEDPDACPF